MATVVKRRKPPERKWNIRVAISLPNRPQFTASDTISAPTIGEALDADGALDDLEAQMERVGISEDDAKTATRMSIIIEAA